MPPKKSRKTASEDVDAMTAVASSATSRALTIPEILSDISSCMDLKDAASCLQLSRLHFEMGVDRVWGDLDSIFPLLELLSPLHYLENEGNSGSWVLGRRGCDANWTRFRLYAARVRELRFRAQDTHKGKGPGHVSFTSLAEVVAQNPFEGSLLPNLRTLRWDDEEQGYPLTVIPFLSGTLQNVSLDFAFGVDAATLRQLFLCLTHRCPNIVEFGFDTLLHVSQIEQALVTWLGHAQNLKMLSLPGYYQSSAVVSALANHPNLQSLCSLHIRRPDVAEQGMAFKFLPQSFLKLESLELDMTFSKAIGVLQSEYLPLQLSRVSLHHPLWHSLELLPEFLQTLVGACPTLWSVVLDLWPVWAEDDQVVPIDFDLLRPLLECSSLEELAIGYAYPVCVPASVVKEMGESWKEMRHLDLCSDPDPRVVRRVPHAGNSINLVQDISAAMPYLEFLAIYLDASEKASLLENDIPEVQFENLETLDVGLSHVPGDDTLAVGMLIESLCSDEPPVIQMGCSTLYWGEDVPQEIKNAKHQWEEVERTMKMIRKKRAQIEKRLSMRI